MHAQSLAGRWEGAAGKWTRGVGWPLAVLALLLFDTVFVKGYQFGVGDQNFYLPQLQAELDSSLYPNSTAIFRSTNRFSFFNRFFAGPVRYLGLEWTFLFAYLVASAGFYFICFVLAEKLTGNRLAAYGFLVLMLPWTTVAETATLVWDPYLTHRVVVIPLCLLGVYHILNRKHVLAYFLFGFSALIHPITAAAFAAACSGALAYDLWRKFISPRVVLLAGGAMLAGASLLLWRLLTFPVDSAFFSPTTLEWVAIVRQRAPYILPEASFLWLWSWGAWFLLFLVAWLAKPVRRREDAVVMAIVISCGVLLAVSLLVGSVMPFLPLARFELARSLLIVILFARIYLAAAFWGGLTSGFSWGRATAALGAVVALSLYGQYLSLSHVGIVLCAVVALLVVQRSVIPDQRRRRLLAGGLVVLAAALLRREFLTVLSFFLGLLSSRRFPGHGPALGLLLLVIVTAVSALKYLRAHALVAACGLLFCLAYVSYVSPEGWGAKTVHLPGHLPVTPWIQAQLWAREHTAKGAVFLAPWRRPSGFPIFSQRSTVADWESGGDVKFNHTFARQWQEQKNDLENFDELATSDFCRLKTKYRFHYIVTRKEQILQYPLLYENAEFTIYQLTDPTCREAQSNILTSESIH